MNARQRVRKAIRFEEPDRVPIDVGGSQATGICVDAYVDLVKCLGLDVGLDFGRGIGLPTGRLLAVLST